MMQNLSPNEQSAFVSSKPAERREQRFALLAVLVSIAIFSLAAPFAALQLAPVPAFIPAYEAALVITDLITAVLLFGQFRIIRSPALFVLASGYLFTACIAFVHALTFPGLLTPTGLLGAGSQSTAWLFMFWHGGFPLFLTAYALLKDAGRGVTGTGMASASQRGRAGMAVLAGVAVVLGLVGALTLLATTHQNLLAVLVVNGRFTAANALAVSILLGMGFVALAVLWWRRPHTVLDLWLMVVACAWLFDIALSGVLNATRYDLGWYGGRIYGLLASSFLLIVLLVENGAHYARLAQLSVELSAANRALERLSFRDGLTDLDNRRSFDRYLADQMAVAQRYQRPLALILCDVDAFKAYNDNYGHQAGDDCLRRVAAALRSCCRRPADMSARYGGEEFALILPDTDLAGATRIAEAALAAVSQLEIAHAHSLAAPWVSVSCGVAVLPQETEMSAQQLVAAADQSLYQAKHRGRNQMVCMQAEGESEHA